MAASAIEGAAHIGPSVVIAACVIPVALFTASIYALYVAYARRLDWLHAVALTVTTLLLLLAVVLAGLGTPLWICLLVALAAPWATVVEYEVLGHAYVSGVLADLD